MKKLIFKQAKRGSSLLLCVFLGISLLCSCGTTRSFEEFTKQLFQDEISGNTLNLHYTLSDPKAYGIDDYDISLGDLSKKSRENQEKELRKTKRSLSRFRYKSLSPKEQLTYDILNDSLDTSIKLCDYELFAEYLSPNNGMQTQLPILLAEYEFHSEQDVKDYLELLRIVDDFYKDIIAFEKEKKEAGLFMSDSICQSVIESCEAFIKNKENSFLHSTFENRIKKLDDISETQASKYIEKNNKILKEEFFPSYEYLVEELTALLGSGKNDLGLYYFKYGKPYYELLVYSETGSSSSVLGLNKRIEEQRNKDLLACQTIYQEDPSIIDKAFDIEWPLNSPEEMISLLQEKMKADFPEPPATTYSISYVDPSLQEFLSPAFYIVAPIDDYTENQIFINNANSYTDIHYFTTLAHEGYPGHLYQTVCSYAAGMDPVRSILDYPGYAEGWATYVEFMSYGYSNLEENINSFLSHNQAATLSLYASSDIGLHYLGWTKEDMHKFWNAYGISDSAAIDEITELILSEPGNYLKYYVGYLEFLDLQEFAKEKYGEDFSLIRFHEAILKIGPAPFSIIKDHFDEYYSPQTESTTD